MDVKELWSHRGEGLWVGSRLDVKVEILAGAAASAVIEIFLRQRLCHRRWLVAMRSCIQRAGFVFLCSSGKVCLLSKFELWLSFGTPSFTAREALATMMSSTIAGALDGTIKIFGLCGPCRQGMFEDPFYIL
jgi:hypothetical protein